jgi:hypothetical protein
MNAGSDNHVLTFTGEKYREYFCCAERVRSPALHDNQCTAYREEHANFADESVSLMADNVWNEGK